MSTREREPEVIEGAPRLYAGFPRYGLTCVVDDADDPNEVTLFPENELERVYTQWISINAAHAIPLEETL
jgi:hypothetical protein